MRSGWLVRGRMPEVCTCVSLRVFHSDGLMGCPPSDYLLYGRLYIPTGRVDAVYTTRLSPGIQALVAAISDPRSNSFSVERTRGANVTTSNVMLSLQHDTGRTCTEYSWSAED